MKDLSYTLKFLTGKQDEEIILSLASQRIGAFKEFPYLYDGNFEYEKEYLKRYETGGDTRLLVALNQQSDLIACATGVPLSTENELNLLIRNHLKLNDVTSHYYMGELIVEKPYQQQGI